MVLGQELRNNAGQGVALHDGADCLAKPHY